MDSPGPSPRKKMKKEDPPASDESDSSSEDEYFDEVTHKALDTIDEFQTEMLELNSKADMEILWVENKYRKLREPIYERRAALIAKIPDFWMKAIVNHPDMSKLLNEEEKVCLGFLEKLEVDEFYDGKKGFRIKFLFKENPYFDNQVLVKEIEFNWTNGESASSSTEIQWKEHNDLSKKQGVLEQKTFFSWFSDNTNPVGDDIAELVIKYDLWRNPLQYFLQLQDMESSNEETLSEDEKKVLDDV